jgi:hypothetical protein
MTQTAQFSQVFDSGSAAATSAQILGQYVVPFATQIAALSVLVAGTTSTATTIDVKKNGTTIFTTTNPAPVVAAGTNVAVIVKPNQALTTGLPASQYYNNGTSNVTSGTNVIAPYIYDVAPLAKLAVGDVIAVSVTTAGTSNTGVSVDLHMVKS